jgi:enoyl-CoA hydratase/carnithine racemase
MAQKSVCYELENLVATVYIDNPPMNALDVATKETICKAFQELNDRRREVKVVILRGAGEKAFAAGADIKGFLELEPETAKRRLTRSHEIYSVIENFQWPVVAAIHGFCLGAGLELALCCDIRYAAESAKFGFPETSGSVFPGNGGTQRTRDHISLGKLKELVYTGMMLDAQEALRYGLIEKVVPDNEIIDAAMKLAGIIMQKGPLAIVAAKKVLNRTRDLPLAAGLELESDFWAGLAASGDMKEGARAFIEKRKPEYKGK